MRKKTTTEFIKEAILIHGSKYDYSKVNYIKSTIKVDIICKIHGRFLQSPSNHLFGHGCSKCAILAKANLFTKQNQSFINKAKIIHDNKYNYSKTNYRNDRIKVVIECPIHSYFEQRPSDHLRGKGCAKCGNNIRKTTEQFIKDALLIHGNKYDYSSVNYLNAYQKIKIKCLTHGEFTQRPYHHLSGGGCCRCKESKGESKISMFLDKNCIEYITQYKFLGCKNIDYLKFDFYLPEYNTCIEYDGIYHFKPIEFFGGQEKFEEVKKRDSLKTNFCLINNINLLRISYLDYNEIENILNSVLNDKKNK